MSKNSKKNDEKYRKIVNNVEKPEQNCQKCGITREKTFKNFEKP